MPAGKGRRDLSGKSLEFLKRGFFDQGLGQRLWDAATEGREATDRLETRRASWIGQAEPLPSVQRVQPTRKLFSWPPFARTRDPIEDDKADILAALEEVTQGRPMASPEIAEARSEAAPQGVQGRLKSGVAA